MRLVCLCLAVVVLGVNPGLAAQEPAKKKKSAPAIAKVTAEARAATPRSSQADDARAIAALVASFTKAFNADDAVAAAATYTEDALVVDEQGQRSEGRAAIRERLAASFVSNPHNSIAITVDSLRFLNPDTALEEGQAVITPGPAGGVTEKSHFIVVYVKRDGQWLQSAVRDEAAHDLTPHERLKELEWLVGDWMNESEDAMVSTTCKWADNGNFLIREFTMKTRGQPVRSGTQRIGWDPSRRQFKTWTFDNDGTFGEGYWTHSGDQWVLKTEGLRQDGLHASATHIITRLGKDRASWQSVDRTVGSAAVPGVDEVIIVRKPPAPGK